MYCVDHLETTAAQKEENVRTVDHRGRLCYHGEYFGR